MRAAMTRRTINANEAIDETDSSVEGFDEGTLAIRSQTTGNVKGKCDAIVTNWIITHYGLFHSVSLFMSHCYAFYLLVSS